MASEEENKLYSFKQQVENMYKNIQKSGSEIPQEDFQNYLKQNENKTILDRPRRQRIVKIKNLKENLKRRVFRCKSCGIIQKTKQLYIKHLSTHIGTPISCIKCKKSFNSRVAYTCHLSLKICEIKTKIIKYQCDQCPRVFRYKRHIDRHLEGHKRNNCTYCEVKLTNRLKLVEHLQTVHSIKLERGVLYKCEHCEKRYVKKRSLYYHLKQHAGDKIVCLECGWMSLTQDEHDIHYEKHDNDFPFKCERCNDRFSRRQQFLVHLKRHDRYKCYTCNESHASRAQILRHKQRGHSVQKIEPQLKCPHCPSAFKRRSVLQIHLKKHIEDKPMHCKYCDISFRSPYLYFKHCASTTHEINSPEKRQLVCEICGKLFMKKYKLEQHLQRVHDQNKRMYNCDYCTHTTNNKKNMMRHMSIHLEDKKECVCEQCGKAFHNLVNLKDHMSYNHSQERHFKCNQCDKAFKRNSELVRHQTCHSEVRPHVCKICHLSYKRTTHLKRHEESQHGTTTTRRVQRLKKDENGILVPIHEEKKQKPKSKKKQKTDSDQIFSIMGTQNGMMTFTIPQIENNLTTVLSINQTYSQDLIQTVTLPYTEIWDDKIQKNVLNNDFSDPNINLDFSNQILNDSQFSENQVNLNSIIEQAINSTATCDILLPENTNLGENVQSTDGFLQNTYQFL